MSNKISNFVSKLKESWKLFKDKDVPTLYKLIPLLGAVYLIYPFDFITDLIPVLGQLDDIAIISATIAIFTNVANKAKNIK